MSKMHQVSFLSFMKIAYDEYEINDTYKNYIRITGKIAAIEMLIINNNS